MKKNAKYCFAIVAIAIVLGVIAFFVFAFGNIYISASSLLFLILITISGVGLVVMLFANILSPRSELLTQAYCCCGNLSVIGAAGLLVAALFTLAMDCCNGYLFAALIALCFVFLVLQLGGAICFLRIYSGCKTCRPADPDCICRTGENYHNRQSGYSSDHYADSRGQNHQYQQNQYYNQNLQNQYRQDNWGR